MTRLYVLWKMNKNCVHRRALSGFDAVNGIGSHFFTSFTFVRPRPLAKQ